MALQKQVQIEVNEAKASYLLQISKLSPESLKILAEKAQKPGIEGRLRMFQHAI